MTSASFGVICRAAKAAAQQPKEDPYQCWVARNEAQERLRRVAMLVLAEEPGGGALSGLKAYSVIILAIKIGIGITIPYSAKTEWWEC